MVLDIEEMNLRIVQQAERKGWNNTINFLFRKLYNEINELDIAIQEKKPVEEIMEEYVDVQYLLAQIKYLKAKHGDTRVSFEKKFEHNEITPKKTSDENGDIIRR